MVDAGSMKRHVAYFATSRKSDGANSVTYAENNLRYAAGMTMPMWKWVRQAAHHSGLSYAEISRRLAARDLAKNYDRSTVQKMTKEHGARDVDALEAIALSEITGYPLPTNETGAAIVETAAPEEVIAVSLEKHELLSRLKDVIGYVLTFQRVEMSPALADTIAQHLIDILVHPRARGPRIEPVALDIAESERLAQKTAPELWREIGQRKT